MDRPPQERFVNKIAGRVRSHLFQMNPSFSLSQSGQREGQISIESDGELHAVVHWVFNGVDYQDTFFQVLPPVCGKAGMSDGQIKALQGIVRNNVDETREWVARFRG